MIAAYDYIQPKKNLADFCDFFFFAFVLRLKLLNNLNISH